MNNSADRDYYTDNLVEVNKSNAVIASENIYNAKGALLVPKGAQIQPEVAQRIISHKLAKPIEDSISLAKSVDGLHLPQHFSQMPTHPEVIELFQTKLSIDILANESARLDHYPLLNQKLTVLSERFPEIYKKTVFGAYLSLLLCQERGFDDTKTHHCFIASLARDLGLLHINPEIVLETGDISGTDWRLLQGHVAISYHILTLIPNIPEKVMTAVLEHHERTDGFGYPRHKIEADLSEEGQVVAFADMVIALFYKYIFGLGYSLQALVPVIQVNAGIHMHENSQAALRLFKTLVKPMKQRHSQKELPQLVARLAKCHPMIDKLFNDAVVFNSDLSDK